MYNKNYHHSKSTKVILHKPDWLLRKERRGKGIQRHLTGIISLFIVFGAQYGWIAGIFRKILGSLPGCGLGWLVGNIIASYSKR